MTGLEYTIQTYELCKKYGDCSVVRNVSMHVPKGQIYGLLGRNGAGKTTIMKMVLGLVRKDSGSVTLFNQVMTGYQSGIYARIGSTIESHGFYSNLTAAENLSVFSRLRGKVNENKICDALGVVGLPYQDKKIFSKYSLGMKQRLAIANAIINDPELLILDEPTNGLDPVGMQREYQDRTIRNILTAPVSREKFMAAKLVVWFLWYLISICLSEVIVTAGIVLSCHACHIGKRSIAGGRSASFRRTDIAGLCVPLDSSIYFWHSWSWYTLLLDMPCINISLRISWFYRSNYFLRKSGSVICSMRPPHYGFHPPYAAVCECNEDSGLL